MKIPMWLAADKELTCTAKCVYGCLASLQHGRAMAYPKQSTLARMLGVSRRAAQMGIAQLEKRGLVKVWKVCISGRIYNNYTVYPALHEDLLQSRRIAHALKIQCAKNGQSTRELEEDCNSDLAVRPLPRRGPVTHEKLLAQAIKARPKEQIT